jgi:flavin reductase (DIM6/NTAB) family NADH-FMN oxidoreductase RutF
MSDPTGGHTDGPTDLEYRRAVSWFLTGVAVMTSLTADGLPHGMTANAVTSVSLDPLLVLVSVDRNAGMADVVQQGRVFALSFLAADQQPLSDRFADERRGFGLEEFTDVGTHAGVTGAPLLDGAAAWLDCELHDVLPGGDHLLVLGRVVHTAVAPDAADALLYTPDGYDTWTRAAD